MGGFSLWHWLIVLVIVLLLFGAGKIPALMGDMAKGVKAFKKGMKDDDEPAAPAAKNVDPQRLEADAAAKPAEKDVAHH